MTKKSFASISFKARQRGASLIEIISYLGVAAIVIIGAVMLLSGAFSSANSNRAIQEISALQLAVKKLYMGQTAGYGTAAMNEQLIKAGQVPSTLNHVASAPWSITNAWNGAVTVSGNSTTFEISYGSIPQNICIEVLTGLGTQGWNAIMAGDTGATAVALPATVAAATTACSTTNVIRFRST